MKERAFCRPSISILILALVLLAALPGLVLAEDGHPRISPEERAIFNSVASPSAKSCPTCAAAHAKCSSTCFGLTQKHGVDGLKSCLVACDNAAATCDCDQAVTLKSEELVSFDWPALTKAACHGTVSCQPAYPSCASWSSYSDCDAEFCGLSKSCGDCTCDEFGHCFCPSAPALKQRQERFRVCFDSLGNSCTEWQQTTVVVDCPTSC